MSRPVSTRRGTPTGWLRTDLEHRNEMKMFQNQIYLQVPDRQVSLKRGLSGSKVWKGASTFGTGSRVPKPSTDFSHELSVLPSPRPVSLKSNSRLSTSSKSTLLMEDVSEVHSSYSWNSSSQGLRLQRELSKLSSSRALKRASEVNQRKVDPSYCLFGLRLDLSNRHHEDGDKIVEPYVLKPLREGLTSKIKTKKCDLTSSNSVHKLKAVELGVEDALSVTVTGWNGQCTTTKSRDTHSAFQSSNLPPFATSDNIDLETEANNIHVVSDSTNTEQDLELGNTHSGIESSDSDWAVGHTRIDTNGDSSVVLPDEEHSDVQA